MAWSRVRPSAGPSSSAAEGTSRGPKRGASVIRRRVGVIIAREGAAIIPPGVEMLLGTLGKEGPARPPRKVESVPGVPPKGFPPAPGMGPRVERKEPGSDVEAAGRVGV